MNEQILRGLPPIDDEYRGPSWWHFSRLVDVTHRPGMRRIALLGLAVNVFAVATGIMEVVWGWGGRICRGEGRSECEYQGNDEQLVFHGRGPPGRQWVLFLSASEPHLARSVKDRDVRIATQTAPAVTEVTKDADGGRSIACDTRNEGPLFCGPCATGAW